MKGFALTIDALMALSIASLMFIGILNLIPQASLSSFNTKQLSNLGNDILSVMDTSGRLSFYVGKSSDFISQDMGYYVGLLSQTFCGNLTLKVYSGSIGPPPSFTLLNSYSNYTQACQKTNEFVRVKRMFVNYDQQRYGLVEFELWLR